MANVKFVLDADEARAVNGFLRVVEAQKKSENQFKRVNGKIKTQNNLMVKMAGHAGRLLVVGSAVRGITSLMGALNEETREVIASMDSLAKSRSINLTVAGGGGGAAARVRKQEEMFAKVAGVPLERASQSVFSIRSLFDSEEEKAQVVKVIAEATPFVSDPIALTTDAGKMRSIFGDEAGSIRAIVNKIMVAAGKSETDPSKFGFEMAKFMDVGKDAGSRDEYLASALAYGSQGKATTSQAAERLKAFLVSLDKEGVEGKGLQGKFNTLLDRGVTPQNFFKDFSASTEAKQGFGILFNDREKIASFANVIEKQESLAGTPNSFLRQTMRQRDADPSLFLPHLKNQANAGIEIARLNDQGTLYDQAVQTAISTAINAVGEANGGSISGFKKLRMKGTGMLLDWLPDSLIKPSTIGENVYRAGYDDINKNRRSGHTGFAGAAFFNDPEGNDPLPARLLEVLESLDASLKGNAVNQLTPNAEPVMPVFRNAQTE